MFIINSNGFMGTMCYRQRQMPIVQPIDPMAVQAYPSQPTSITDLSTDTATPATSSGSGLTNKFKTIQMHNADNKLKKFISLKF